MTSELTPAERISAATTLLFVPGNRPDRFAKAYEAGADAVIIDLEDAVAENAKADALMNAWEGLADRDALQAIVRLNSSDSPHFVREVAAVRQLVKQKGHGLLGIAIPKAANPLAMNEIRSWLPPELALLALIESAEGLLNSFAIASTPGVTRIGFGAIDFALDIGAGSGDRYIDYARSHLVVTSRASGIAAPIDSPSTAIKDTAAVAESALLAKNFGFGGKLCIHPAQLESVRTAFAPTVDEVAWAHAVIAADEAAGTGAATFDGAMIDRPVVDRARRILQREA